MTESFGASDRNLFPRICVREESNEFLKRLVKDLERQKTLLYTCFDEMFYMARCSRSLKTNDRETLENEHVAITLKWFKME